MTDVADEQVARPTIQVAGGNPTDEELAAVLAALVAATSAHAPDEQRDDRPLAGGWKSYTRTLRRQVLPGREAWRFSGRP